MNQLSRTARVFFLVSFQLAVAVAGEIAPRADAEAVEALGTIGSAVRLDDPALLRGNGMVRWRSWNGAALAEAARADKPILLFITGNWCHFGKVMERATFSDIEIATRLNEEFIPIRLNRDDRPDVDLRIQQAVQSLTGSRGWPLTAWLTPEGKPFFGATFLSADEDAAAGRAGMRSLINDVAWSWKRDRELVKRQAANLEEELQKTAVTPDLRSEIPEDLLAAAAAKAVAEFGQPVKGGRFPAPRTLDLLLTHYLRANDQASLNVALAILDAMLRGGIYDQLEGGFHRCCIDSNWKVPRFEKLLAVNAEMLPVLLHAWQVTGEPRYRAALAQTLNFWMGHTENEGRFFSASLAGGTNDLDDGRFYTWDVREIEGLLRDETDCRLAQLYFDIRERGELPGSAPSRNVLCQAATIDEAAAQLKIMPAEAAQRIQKIIQTLCQERKRRPQPAADHSVYFDDNALMAAAFIECGHALEEKDVLSRGLKTLHELLAAIATDGKGGIPKSVPHRIGIKEPDATPALSRDEAALAYACATAFDATRDNEYARACEESLQRLYQNFWDKKEGGYVDRVEPEGAEQKLGGWKLKSYQDTTEASTNALIALSCNRMGALTARPEFSARAKKIVQCFSQSLEKLGPFASALICAADALESPPVFKKNRE